jgi:endonuclease YncB( thermonuclease family)
VGTIKTSKSPRFQGEVQINGKIGLDQFYSRGGKSDADTVKINLTVDSIRFRSDQDTEWQENLTVLEDAYVRKNPVIDDKRRIKIRLQGIDAPELHYRADSKGHSMIENQKSKLKLINKEYRQPWGAKAASQLAEFLYEFHRNEDEKKYVDAYAFSRVNTPNDLFDAYGRAVADIVLSESKINMNQWLVERGWAFPDFYNSMSKDEVSILKDRGESAKSSSKGIWKDFSHDLVPFDFDLYFPTKDNEIVVDNDAGNINLPKLFRRQTTYEVLKKATVFDYSSLKKYLATRKDRCYLLEEYFETGDENEKLSPTRNLGEFVGEDGTIFFSPGDLIFIEGEAVVKGNDGRIINKWY